ncbi:MAG: YdeI/OmpD-associated family protein [Paracoccaceae bacterium]
MTVSPDNRNLTRAIQPMPDFVAQALRQRNLKQTYDRRPAHQRNDYLAWIDRAVGDATKTKRLNQMLHELQIGGVYMGMEWNPRK